MSLAVKILISDGYVINLIIYSNHIANLTTMYFWLICPKPKVIQPLSECETAVSEKLGPINIGVSPKGAGGGASAPQEKEVKFRRKCFQKT